jgi:hypothetical protein
MNQNQPPKAATWLLRHFGSSPNNESVIGDLDERYRQGRSYFWYWRQAFQAIVASFLNEVCPHKLLAIRTLVIGWIIKVMWFSIFTHTYGRPPQRLFHEGIETTLLLALIAVLAMMGSGWIIARTHPSHYRAMVLLFVAVEVIGIPLTAFSDGMFGFYYWVLPVTKITNAALFHYGIIRPVAAMWTSAGIMAMSILIGAGFFRTVRGTGSQVLESAST